MTCYMRRRVPRRKSKSKGEDLRCRPNLYTRTEPWDSFNHRTITRCIVVYRVLMTWLLSVPVRRVCATVSVRCSSSGVFVCARISVFRTHRVSIESWWHDCCLRLRTSWSMYCRREFLCWILFTFSCCQDEVRLHSWFSVWIFFRHCFHSHAFRTCSIQSVDDMLSATSSSELLGREQKGRFSKTEQDEERPPASPIVMEDR